MKKDRTEPKTVSRNKRLTGQTDKTKMREGVKRETEKGRKRNLKTEPDDDDTKRRSCMKRKKQGGK